MHPTKQDLLLYWQGLRRTVIQRFVDPEKDAFWKAPKKEYRIDTITVIVGELKLPKDNRISAALVNYVESLLIYRHKYLGNIQNTESREISRPGMRVRCAGGWVGCKPEYRDR